MDAQVKETVVPFEDCGNLVGVEFMEKKTSVALADNLRQVFLRFKTKDGKKRANMAFVVPKLDADNFGAKPDHDFVNSLIAEYQDSLFVRCADKEITWEQATSQEFMVKDYFDNTRTSSGRKVTKETIAEWYGKTVSATILARALAKNAQMGPEVQARIVAGYKEMFQKFTGYNLVNAFTDTQLDLLSEVMIQTTFAEDDEIATYVLDKITSIGAAKREQDNLLESI